MQLEDKVSHCPICQAFHNIPSNKPVISHKIPDILYNKVGIDLFEFENEYYLIVVDYYSKLSEIARLNNTASSMVIHKLKEVFGRHGIPQTVISDNGTQFISELYRKVTVQYNFKHIYSSPMYPRSNGQVERTVQTIKQLIKKARAGKNDIHYATLTYRNTKL